MNVCFVSITFNKMVKITETYRLFPICTFMQSMMIYTAYTCSLLNTACTCRQHAASFVSRLHFLFRYQIDKYVTI